RPDHGVSPGRFGEHVEAQGRAVSPIERLEVDDGEIDRSLPRGVDTEVGGYFDRDQRADPLAVLGLDAWRPPDALDARATFFELQAMHEASELGEAHLPVDAEQSGASMQRVGVHV